jgi:hypothetical protein
LAFPLHYRRFSACSPTKRVTISNRIPNSMLLQKHRRFFRQKKDKIWRQDHRTMQMATTKAVNHHYPSHFCHRNQKDGTHKFH